MKNGNKRDLSDKQHAAIRLLIAGTTQVTVAEQVGVTPETLSRWLNSDSLFIATLNYNRQAAYTSVIERMRSLAHAAVDALENSLDSENEMVRLKAAQAILKMINLDDIAAPAGPTTEQGVELEQYEEEARMFKPEI